MICYYCPYFCGRKNTIACTAASVSSADIDFQETFAAASIGLTSDDLRYLRRLNREANEKRHWQFVQQRAPREKIYLLSSRPASSL